MSGVIAFEGDLNAIVKEYLDFNSLQRTADIFEKECIEKDKPIEPGDSKPKVNSKLLSIQNDMLHMFETGQREKFMTMWRQQVPEQIRRTDSVAQKLEFYLHVYFGTYPLRHKTGDRVEAMQWFKEYLENPNSSGNSLSGTTEFLPFYALPFMPNPETHQSYKELFAERWVPDLQARVEKFLTLALQSTAQPRLFELYNGGGGRDAAALEQKSLESDRKAQAYLKRFHRVQNDYHNLIGITADLVDSLESTIQGNNMSPEYLQQICMKLFSNQVRQSVDFTRPGTAGAVLRQSVAPPQGLPRRQTTPGNGYDYDKIKRDLTQASDKTKCFLLQALRWKLTRSRTEERDAFMSAYVSHDLLGCNGGEHRSDILALLAPSSPALVRENIARLFNAFASLVEGRSYLATNPDLVRELMESLHSETQESATRANVLGCLQKLSLRRSMQSLMIDEGIIEWLVKLLDDNDSMSDYTLEYSTALLMNLCLRTSGKRRCVHSAHKILTVISNLLGHDNSEILPYVNGALYSILAIPSIREEAKAMDMEAILEQFISPDQQEMNRQIDFIIKQLNSSEDIDDRESDDEEEDEDEEDQDSMEPDIDKGDNLKAQSGDLDGDRLLNTRYVTTMPSSARSKRRPTDGAMNQEEVLRRPVTPSHFKGAGETAVVHVQPKNSRPPTGHNRERPPTRSGSRGNSRPGTSNIDTDAHGSEYVSKSRTSSSHSRRSGSSSSKKHSSASSSSNNVRPSQKAVDRLTGNGMVVDTNEYSSAFGTRAKIPRTPDVRPTSGGGAVPRPEYSDSLPTSRPNSAGRPSSAGGSKQQTSPSPRTPRTPKSRTQNHR